jgi:hypothetical protein
MVSRRTPRGRHDRLLVERLGDETLVYDLDRHQAHCLNRTAAAVWSACDGERDVAAIARYLGREMPDSSVDLVEVALARLARAHLLTEAGDAMPRRAALRRLSVTAALLPIISSIIVPEPAQAASCFPAGRCCTTKADCCPPLNCSGPQTCPPSNKRCQ